jgi:uncharacterized protein YndB with AHSA1/START domain
MDGVLDALGLTDRTVSIVDLDGRPARCVQVSRSYPTDVTDLWDALTNPDRIPRWFLPIKGDLRHGGQYQLEGNAGGTVELCEPPRRFRVTWVMGEGAPTRLTVTLTDEPGSDATRLQLEHVGHVPDEFWAQFGPGATGVGWDLTLHGLGLHLSSGATTDPQQFATWTVCAEGTEFIQRSSEAWKEAAIASGAPAEEAAASAARTFAFYTGRPDQADQADQADRPDQADQAGT